MENSEQLTTSESLHSTHKTTIEREAVISFLNLYYKNPITNLLFIGGGEGSQAFSFEIDQKNFILRVNKHSNNGFKKDQYAFSNFEEKDVPIPEIIDIGEIDNDLFFALSKKVDGEMIKNLSVEDFNNTMQSFFKTLGIIHSKDITHTTGYGKWNTEGGAEYNSWKSVLLDVDIHAKNMFEDTFLEKDVWEKIYAKFITLIEFCPEDRYLIHGDYSFDNVLADKGKITGVVDWETSMYGDFLFDIAWLNFWSKDINYKEQYEKYSSVLDISNLNERLLCYELFIGLGSLSFYVYSNQKEKYERSKEKLLKLIQD